MSDQQKAGLQAIIDRMATKIRQLESQLAAVTRQVHELDADLTAHYNNVHAHQQ